MQSNEAYSVISISGPTDKKNLCHTISASWPSFMPWLRQVKSQLNTLYYTNKNFLYQNRIQRLQHNNHFFPFTPQKSRQIIAASTQKIGPVQRMIIFGTVMRGTVMWLNDLVAEWRGPNFRIQKIYKVINRHWIWMSENDWIRESRKWPNCQNYRMSKILNHGLFTAEMKVN